MRLTFKIILMVILTLLIGATLYILQFDPFLEILEFGQRKEHVQQSIKNERHCANKHKRDSNDYIHCLRSFHY